MGQKQAGVREERHLTGAPLDEEDSEAEGGHGGAEHERVGHGELLLGLGVVQRVGRGGAQVRAQVEGAGLVEEERLGDDLRLHGCAVGVGHLQHRRGDLVK